MNRPITSDEIEAVIIKLLAQENPGPDHFTELKKKIKEDVTPILLRLFQTIQAKRLPNTFYEASIILIQKPDKDTTKKELYRPLLQMKIDTTILNKGLANRI